MADSLPPDHYAALGLGKQATVAEVKTAYKKAALKYHPDKAKDKNTAADLFHKISQAYETLIDDDKRRKWEEQCRLAQLKKDIQERRGPPPSAYGGSPMPPRPSHGDPRYAYAPRNSYPTSPSYPPQRQYEPRRPRDHEPDDETRSQFAESRTTGRKYTGEYMRPPPPPQSVRSNATRNDAPRRPSYERSRMYESEKKRTDQHRQQERFNKRRPVSSDSAQSDSDSDDGADDRGYDRSRRDAAMPRFAHQAKMDDARDYMERARQSEHPYPDSRSYREEAFGSEQQPRRRPNVDPRDSYESRPGMRRTPTTRQNTQESVPRSRAASIRESSQTGRTRSKTPEEERRPGPAPVPSMPQSVSSPPGGGQLPKMTSSTRRSTVPDQDKQSTRGGPVRNNTMPTPERSDSFRNDRYHPENTRRTTEAQQGDRQRPTLHHGSSGLKKSFTNDDSGYSTSNSPSEEVQHNENIPFSQPTANVSTKSTRQTYKYAPSSTGTGNTSTHVHVSEDSDADTEDNDRSTRAKVPFNNVSWNANPDIRTARRTTAASRTPSPHRTRANSSAQRTQPHASHTSTKGPPPSSYPTKYAPSERGPDPYHPSKHADAQSTTGSRRPSLSRSNSAKVSTRSERPKMERGNSSSNITINTAGITAVGNGKNGYLFGEKMTASPTDINGKSDNERNSGGESGRDRDSGKEGRRGSGKDRERDSGRERTTRDERERTPRDERERDGGRESARERPARDEREKPSRKGSRAYEETIRSVQGILDRDRVSAKKSPRMSRTKW
ncbi:MAG: hypothetical protein Q9162_007930 [Coniocarpon cinnabarinum]